MEHTNQMESDNESLRSEDHHGRNPSPAMNQQQHLQQQQISQQGASGMYSVVMILQHLYTIGMVSYADWEQCVPELKSQASIKKDPAAMQLVFTLNSLHAIFGTHVFSHMSKNGDHSQGKHEHYSILTKTFDEIRDVFKSVLNKKPYKDLLFHVNVVQKIGDCVDSLLNPKDTSSTVESRKRKSKKSKKSKKSSKESDLSSISSSSSSESDSSSGSEDDDDDDEGFAGIFHTKRSKKLKNQPVDISQEFCYLRNGKRYKLKTPGEQGSHIIKLEVTKTKDIKNNTPIDLYWTKVSKRGVFLLDVENSDDDKATLDVVSKMLVKYGKKIKNVDSVKSSNFVLRKK